MKPLQLRALYVAIALGGATLLVAGITLIFFADGEVVAGSEAWCNQMLELPHASWTEPDFPLFAKECLDPAPVVY